VAQVAWGGHGGPVTDIAWDPSGRFAASVSDDQTSRLYGAWRAPGRPPVWRELARPQVHGYDLTCIAFVRPHVLLSGADEKARCQAHHHASPISKDAYTHSLVTSLT
jgi:elongator complex protein 2